MSLIFCFSIWREGMCMPQFPMREGDGGETLSRLSLKCSLIINMEIRTLYLTTFSRVSACLPGQWEGEKEILLFNLNISDQAWFPSHPRCHTDPMPGVHRNVSPEAAAGFTAQTPECCEPARGVHLWQLSTFWLTP